MTSTTYTCDKCGETVTSDRHALILESGSIRHRAPEAIDLCPACVRLLLTWLAARQPTT